MRQETTFLGPGETDWFCLPNFQCRAQHSPVLGPGRVDLPYMLTLQLPTGPELNSHSEGGRYLVSFER